MRGIGEPPKGEHSPFRAGRRSDYHSRASLCIAI